MPLRKEVNKHITITYSFPAIMSFREMHNAICIYIYGIYLHIRSTTTIICLSYVNNNNNSIEHILKVHLVAFHL